MWIFYCKFFFSNFENQGPVIQSIISLPSSLVVKMLTALVSTISNSVVFLLKKMWVAFANAKATHIFFSKNISIYAIFNDQSFNDTLTNDTVSFDQLGPGDFNRLNMVGFLGKVRNFNIFWLKKKKKALSRAVLFIF